MDPARPGDRIAPIDESEIGIDAMDAMDTPSLPDESADAEELEA
ncbi:hypothetical protein ACF07V_36445 [Streptomyces sp. NPDC015661]